MCTTLAPATQIEVQNLVKEFGVGPPWRRRRVVALAGVSFRIAPGSWTLIEGPNGSGKSTLLRVLNGTVLPTRGSVRVMGLHPGAWPRELRRRMGWVSETERTFFLRLSGWENLRFFADLYGVDRRWPGPVQDLLDAFDLGPVLHRPVHTYSQGMRHKLALVRVFLWDPELLLLDEPDRHLDDTGLARFSAFLADGIRRRAWTVIVTSHRPQLWRTSVTHHARLEAGHWRWKNPAGEPS